MEQLSLFNLPNNEKYKITKPIRLIELFAGYGSQSLALKFLGVDFETYKICEFDKYAVQTYNAFHNTNFITSDITQIHSCDLEIVDTAIYEYIMFYSFPCTDLSIAGKMRGMEKGANTRSGLLWQVERLLNEMQEKPQLLIMENVPQVLKATGWQEWQESLNSFGYTNYIAVLNAKEFGIPQNRRRCFMISILNSNNVFNTPKKMQLDIKLKDILEKNIEEKYYMPNEKAATIINQLKNKDTVLIDMVQAKREGKPREYIDIAPTLNARDYKEPRLIQVGELDIKGHRIVKAVYDPNGLAPTLTTMQGGQRQPKITDNKRVRKLTPCECFKLMGVPNSINKKTTVSNSQQYKQAGNSIVTTVLMAIFGELLGIDYQTKITELVEELKKCA